MFILAYLLNSKETSAVEKQSDRCDQQKWGLYVGKGWSAGHARSNCLAAFKQSPNYFLKLTLSLLILGTGMLDPAVSLAGLLLIQKKNIWIWTFLPDIWISHICAQYFPSLAQLIKYISYICSKRCCKDNRWCRVDIFALGLNDIFYI